MIKLLKKRSKISEDEAIKAVTLIWDEMAAALANGEGIEIRRLFSLNIRHYKAYVSQDPRTGGKINVPPKKLPFFKCSKELKQRVDY